MSYVKREVLLGSGNWLHEHIKVHGKLAVRFTNPAFARQLCDHLDHTIETRCRGH